MITDFFNIDELVCMHVYYKFNSSALTFFDSRLLITMEAIRRRIDKPILINNWRHGELFSQRGFRCIQCPLVKDAISKDQLYVSPHMTGQAFDFDVVDMTADESRKYIFDNANLWPYSIRLENNVAWIHLDTRNNSDEKVIFFNA
jgi:hypothetical protein